METLTDSKPLSPTEMTAWKLDAPGQLRWELTDGTVVTITPGFPEAPFGASGTEPDRVLALHRDRNDVLQVVAAARLLPTQDPAVSWVSLEVAPPLRCLGLGTRLLRHVIPYARKRGVSALQIEAPQENHAIQRCCLNVGFTLHRDDNTNRVLARLDLTELSGLILPDSP